MFYAIFNQISLQFLKNDILNAIFLSSIFLSSNTEYFLIDCENILMKICYDLQEHLKIGLDGSGTYIQYVPEPLSLIFGFSLFECIELNRKI